MIPAPLRRALVVGAGYAVTAWLVLRVAAWARLIFALPELFLVLLRWGVGLGFPVAVLLAWYYPRLGYHGEPPPTRGAP
jgi:hypothetical protein